MNEKKKPKNFNKALYVLLNNTEADISICSNVLHVILLNTCRVGLAESLFSCNV